MSSAAPTVTVKQGKINGKLQKSVLNEKTFYSFQGIPYAKSPIGELRFQAPQPAEKWTTDVLDATKEGNMCVQKDTMFTQTIIGSEDCLFLNVHTPELPKAENENPKKAVMVYFHGGAFAMGTGSEGLYSPDYLIERDIVFVSINYRLHILGFLSLDIPECPGNAALKDMVLALQWVKENIKSFGGDSDNVTIFGESAGSAAVHYLIISPLAEGLFHKAILQSGSCLNPWAFTTTPVDSAFEFGKLLGFEGTDKKDLLTFLLSLKDSELADGAFKYQNELKKKYPARCTTFAFVPCVESVKEGAFLPEYPWHLMKKAKPLPVISGVTNQEGLVAYKVEKPETHLKLFEEHPTLFVSCNFNLDEIKSKEMGAEICKFYFEEQSDKLQRITDLYSDYIITKDFYSTLEFALNSEKYPVYQYLFSYESERNLYKKILSPGVDIKGACHADELSYLFFAKLFPSSEYSEDDLYIIRSITTLWTNFAKTGNPNGPGIDVNWTPATHQKPVYLKIDKNLATHEGKLFEDRISFWENLLKRYTPRV